MYTHTHTYIHIYIYNSLKLLSGLVSKYSDLMPSGTRTRYLQRGVILAEDYVYDALYLARQTLCVLYVVCAAVLLAAVTFLHLAMQIIAFCTADIPKPYSVPKLICAVFAGEILNFLIFFFSCN